MYTYLIAEPTTNATALWVFGSIFIFTLVSFVLAIIWGGKKDEESRIAANKREPRHWDSLYVAHIAGEKVVLDEFESAIVGDDMPPLMEVQSN